MKVPPCRLANSQLNMRRARVPHGRSPVGLGAKRTRVFDAMRADLLAASRWRVKRPRLKHIFRRLDQPDGMCL